MKAGREMDALIAEKVMDWHLIIPEHSWCDCADGKHECRIINLDAWEHNQAGISLKGFTVFRPSTDIAAAWQVVEEYMVLNFHDPGGFMLVYDQDEDEWNCSFHTDWPNEHLCAYAKTAPEAICLAALKAMEVE